MFSITNLEEAEAIDLLHSLLSQGVPPTALARAFAIDPDFIRGVAEQVRIRQYGTAELAEVMNWLQWEAIDEAVDLRFFKKSLLAEFDRFDFSVFYEKV